MAAAGTLLHCTFFQVHGNKSGINGGNVNLPAEASFSSAVPAPGEAYSLKIDLTSPVGCNVNRLSMWDSAQGFIAIDYNLATVYFQRWIRIDTAPAANSEEIVVLASNSGASNLKASFRINSARKIQFHDSAAVGLNAATATMTNALTLGQWYWVRIKAVTGSPTATGSIEVWDSNGLFIEQMDCTGDWLATNVERIWGTRLFDRNGQSTVAYYGGCFASDAGWLPLYTRVGRAIARADGNYGSANWVKGSGGTVNRYLEVDDAPPTDGNATYLAGSALANGDKYSSVAYGASSVVPASAVIHGVFAGNQVYDAAVAHDAYWLFGMRFGGVDYMTTVPHRVNVADPLLHMRGVWKYLNPATGVAWTVANATGIESIIQASDNGGAIVMPPADYLRCSWMGCFYVYSTGVVIDPQYDGKLNSTSSSSGFGEQPTNQVGWNAVPTTNHAVWSTAANPRSYVSLASGLASTIKCTLRIQCTLGAASAQPWQIRQMIFTGWNDVVASGDVTWLARNGFDGTPLWDTPGATGVTDSTTTAATTGLLLPTVVGAYGYEIGTTIQGEHAANRTINLLGLRTTESGTAATAQFSTREGTVPWWLDMTWTDPAPTAPTPPSPGSRFRRQFRIPRERA